MARKDGRARKDTRGWSKTVWLPAQMAERLEHQCGRLGLKPVQAIRQAVEIWLRREETAEALTDAQQTFEVVE